MNLKPAAHGNTPIALIVSSGDGPLWEAQRYISVLPTFTALYLYAAVEHRRAIKEACHDAGVVMQLADTAPDAVRMSGLVVIFGENPFTERDVEILASQGIPVEHSGAKRRKPKRKAVA